MLPRLAKSNATGGSAAQRGPRVRGAAYPRPGRRASLHSRVLTGEDSAFKPWRWGRAGAADASRRLRISRRRGESMACENPCQESLMIESRAKSLP